MIHVVCALSTCLRVATTNQASTKNLFGLRGQSSILRKILQDIRWLTGIPMSFATASKRKSGAIYLTDMRVRRVLEKGLIMKMKKKDQGEENAEVARVIDCEKYELFGSAWCRLCWQRNVIDAGSAWISGKLRQSSSFQNQKATKSQDQRMRNHQLPNNCLTELTILRLLLDCSHALHLSPLQLWGASPALGTSSLGLSAFLSASVRQDRIVCQVRC